MEIKMRAIEKPDAAVFSEIAKETFFDTFTGTCTAKDMQLFLEEFFNEKALKGEVEDKLLHSHFAMVNNVPVAYIQFKEDYSAFPKMQQWKALELKRLYVLKEFHGKGVANQLMDFFLEYAGSNKFEAVWLGVWEFNYRAQKFYNKYGFKPSGFTHDFPIGNTPQTDIWMWKFLDGGEER